MQAITQPQNLEPAPNQSTWWRILLSGLGFYLVGLLILLLTHNPNLFPTVVMLGVFMAAGDICRLLYDHRHLSQLNAPAVAQLSLRRLARRDRRLHSGTALCASAHTGIGLFDCVY
ncbi:MAG: hypothetical protein R2911_01350 [Caldilineaceae bacterium]